MCNLVFWNNTHLRRNIQVPDDDSSESDDDGLELKNDLGGRLDERFMNNVFISWSQKNVAMGGKRITLSQRDKVDLPHDHINAWIDYDKDKWPYSSEGYDHDAADRIGDRYYFL